MRSDPALLTPFGWELIRTAPDAVTTVVDPGSAVFAGHFPGRPVVPGVCLIDLVCRAAALIASATADAGPPAGLLVERARFVSPALPGDVLTVTVAPPEPGAEELLGVVSRQGDPVCRVRLRRAGEES